MENVALYGDKLGDNDIYNNFIHILTVAKKSAKAEAKVSYQCIHLTAIVDYEILG